MYGDIVFEIIYMRDGKFRICDLYGVKGLFEFLLRFIINEIFKMLIWYFSYREIYIE